MKTRLLQKKRELKLRPKSLEINKKDTIFLKNLKEVSVKQLF